MTVSSRVAVMDAGRIEQVGTPASVYEYPASRFVADFIGSVNMIEGRVVEQQGESLRIASDAVGCDILMDHATPLPEGTSVAVALRPEKVTASEQPPADSSINCVRGIVAEQAYLGDVSIYHVRLDSGLVMQVQLTNLARIAEPPLTWDQEVWLTWQPGSGMVFPA